MVDYIYKIEYVKGLTNNSYNFLMDFHDWINNKFIEWRGYNSGREGSKAEFARWLGISYKSLYKYFEKNGEVPKSHKVINKLIKKYGSEVYEILNIQAPETPILKLEEIQPLLNLTQQKKLMKRINETIDKFLREEMED